MADANFTLVQFSKFSIGSVFPAMLGSFLHLCMATVKTFICDDLSVLKSAKKIHQNRLTHLCAAVVNCLGDSDESPTMGDW